MYAAGAWPEMYTEPPYQPGVPYLVPIYAYCQTSCVSSQNYFLQPPPNDDPASEAPLENSGQTDPSGQALGFAYTRHEQPPYASCHGGMLYAICSSSHDSTFNPQDATQLDQNDIPTDSNTPALPSGGQDAGGADDSLQEQDDAPHSKECSLSPVIPDGPAPAADAIAITGNVVPTVTIPKASIAASETANAIAPAARFVETDTLSPDPGDDPGFGVYGSDGCWYPIKRPHKNSNGCQGFNPAAITETAPTLPVEHRRPYYAKQGPPFIRSSLAGCRRRHWPMTPQRKSMPLYNHFHRLDLPTEALGRPVFLQSCRTKDQPCVEDLWFEHKNLLFRHLPDEWLMKAVNPVFRNLSGWTTFSDFAKVRFYCRECQDGWTSMHGMVMFYYRWDRSARRGEVMYQISGQKCAACSPGRFEYPLWYPEEAQKVMTNLYYKIASDVYGMQTPNYIRTRRPGTPVTRHNMNLCQGCSLGSCRTASME